MGSVEKPAETRTSIRLASHLVREPNSLSGGSEFECPMWTWTLHFSSILFDAKHFFSLYNLNQVNVFCCC